jgi:hypothetical protein
VSIQPIGQIIGLPDVKALKFFRKKNVNMKHHKNEKALHF